MPSHTVGRSLRRVKDLAILSPSNVAINYQLALLPERSLAFVIDLMVTLLIGQLFVSTVGALLVQAVGDDGFLFMFVQFYSRLIIFLSYFAIVEYLFEGVTLGKRALKLRTIRIDGAVATFETYATRAVMLFLDFFLGFGPVGLLAAGSNPLRQRIGDRIAQTVVIRSQPSSLYQLEDILAIKTASDHEVVYPQATSLDIEQALLLKQLIVRWKQQPSDKLRLLIHDAGNRLAQSLGIETVPPRKLEFIRQVLRDYIVLTR